jgi:hypothetical protein
MKLLLLNAQLDKWQFSWIAIHYLSLLRWGRSICKQIKPDIAPRGVVTRSMVNDMTTPTETFLLILSETFPSVCQISCESLALDPRAEPFACGCSGISARADSSTCARTRACVAQHWYSEQRLAWRQVHMYASFPLLRNTDIWLCSECPKEDRMYVWSACFRVGGHKIHVRHLEQYTLDT